MKLNIRLRLDGSLFQVEVLKQFRFMGFDFFVHETPREEGSYTVSEFKTGLAVIHFCKTIKGSMRRTQRELKEKENMLHVMVDERIKQFGIANEYKGGKQ